MSQISEEQLHKVRFYLGASKLLHYRLTPEIQKVRLGGNDLGCSQFYQLGARIMHGSSCSYLVIFVFVCLFVGASVQPTAHPQLHH